MKTIALTLALLCTLVSLSQVTGKDDSKSKSCNPYMFKDCCFMPQLISRDVFDQCLKEVGGKSKILFEKFQAKLSRKKALKGTTTQPREKRSTLEDKTSPICMMNCVLEKQGMMKNGTVMVSEIRNIFKTKGDATWQPILDAAITKCVADLGKVKPADIPSKPCSYAPAGFMTCIRRHLTIYCPDQAKSKDYKKDNFCLTNKEALETCDPFYVEKALANKQSAGVNQKATAQQAKDKKKAWNRSNAAP